ADVAAGAALRGRRGPEPGARFSVRHAGWDKIYSNNQDEPQVFRLRPAYHTLMRYDVTTTK
ncbi:MAG TPA: hypothetical protein VFW76_13195, partial [Ktedonobacterales bacterium]|nr:hypothetical protein [Ktedonobacterales bacterium]